MKKMKRIRRIAASILVVVCSIICIICIRETALFPTEVQAAEEEGYNLKYTLSQPEGDYADALTLNVSSTEDSAQIPVTDWGERRLMYYALYKPNTAVSESVAVTTVEQESDFYTRAEKLLEGYTTYKSTVPEADAGVAYEAYQEFLGIMDGSITDDASLQYNVSGCSSELYRTTCVGDIGFFAKTYTAIACLDSYFQTLQDAGCVVENAYGFPSFLFAPSTMSCNEGSESTELTLGLDDDELCADYYLFVWDKTKGSADDLVTPVKSVYHYAIKTTPTLTSSQSTPLVYTGLDLTETLFNQFSATDKLDNSVVGTYTAKITNVKGEEVSTLKDAGTYTVDVTFTPEDTDTYVVTNYSTLSVEVNKQNQVALGIDSIGTKTYGDEAFTLSTIGGSGDGAVSFTSFNPDIISISGTTATIHKAGTVILKATKAESENYDEATTTESLTVGKKALTVKADDKLNILAGSTMPQFTYSINGLVGSDTFTNPVLTTKAVDMNTVGEFEVAISGGTLTNADSYRVTYTNGKMSIVRIGVADAVVSGITDINYNGKARVQSGLSVKVSGKMLTYGTDYEVTYKNNTAIGTATIIITGKGIYTGSIEKNFQVKVSKGANYTISNMKYKVTNAKTNGTGTVTLIGSTRSKAVLKGSLKIGDTVKIGGKRFKITVVGDKAFKGYTKLTKVTIGKNVTTTGKEAFSGCTKVTSVTIGTGLKAISTKSFYNCKKLETITISSKRLKTVGKAAIKTGYGKAVMKVPSSKVKAYKKLFKSSTGFTNKMELKRK